MKNLKMVVYQAERPANDFKDKHKRWHIRYKMTMLSKRQIRLLSICQNTMNMVKTAEKVN